MLVRQKQNPEQDLITIKAHTGPIEKNVFRLKTFYPCGLNEKKDYLY